MTRTRVATVLTLLLLCVVLATSLGFAQNFVQEENTTDTDASPGERLSGVLYSQGVELENDVVMTLYRNRLSEATTDEATARVIANKLENVDQNLTEIRNQKKDLIESYRDGSIPKDRYDAKVAPLLANVRDMETILKWSRKANQEMPDEVAEEHDIPSTLDTLENEVEDFKKVGIVGPREVLEGQGVESPSFDIESLVETYNKNYEDASIATKRLFGNEKMNVYVDTVDEGTQVYYIRTKGGEVTVHSKGKKSDITLEVYTSESVIRRVKNAENPEEEFNQALKDDDIVYKPQGSINKAKYIVGSSYRFVVDSTQSLIEDWVGIMASIVSLLAGFYSYRLIATN